MLRQGEKGLRGFTVSLLLLHFLIGSSRACPATPDARPKMDPSWNELHARYAREVAQNDEAEDGQEWQVVFYGASAIERFRGTNVGFPWDTAAGVPEVFRDQMQGYRAHALGISGDQTGHLLWRLQNGELGRRRPLRLAVLFIGINDIAQSICPRGPALDAAVSGILDRMRSIVGLFLSVGPDTRVLVLGLTPFARDCGISRGSSGVLYEWPNCYTDLLAAVNSGYKALADGTDRVRFLDTSAVVLPQGQSGLRNTVDGLHLGPDGVVQFLEMVKPEIRLAVGPPGPVP